MKNSIVKLIIKELSDAPRHSARVVLDKLTDPQDRAESLRIFNALNIAPKEDGKQ